MLACSLCGLQSPEMAAASVAAGGLVALFCFLRPLRMALSSFTVVVPRRQAADVSSLIVLLMFPAVLMVLGFQQYPIQRVLLLTLVFASLIVYVWLRAMWILNSLNIIDRGKRFLFAAILLPCIVAAGYNIAHWLFALPVVAMFPGGSFILGYTLFCAIVAAPFLAGAYYGLRHVFPRIYNTAVTHPPNGDNAA